MRSGFPLVVCAAGLLHSSIAMAAPKESQTMQALTRCLSPSSVPKLAYTPSATIPPGISRGSNIKVAAVPSTHDRTFSYQGTSPHELACGVVLYGPVSLALKRQMKAVIDGYSPRWTPQALGPYRLGQAVTGEQTYWGDPKAPGIVGVLMIERPPSKDRPTVEIDYHRLLVQ